MNIIETAVMESQGKGKGKDSYELYEKYTRKGDEAIVMGDRIVAETHYQKADHYLRLLKEHKKDSCPVTSLSSAAIIEVSLGTRQKETPKTTRRSSSLITRKKTHKLSYASLATQAC